MKKQLNEAINIEIMENEKSAHDWALSNLAWELYWWTDFFNTAFFSNPTWINAIQPPRVLAPSGKFDLTLNKVAIFARAKPEEAGPLLASQGHRGPRPPGAVIFVGDSMADAMMVREANKADTRFAFANVYGHSHPRDVHIRDFIEFGCELNLPSFNDLPDVLERLRRGNADCG